MAKIFTFTTNPPDCRCEGSMLPLSTPDIKLFDTTAKTVAEELANPELLKEYKKKWEVKVERKANAPTQLRRFYD